MYILCVYYIFGMAMIAVILGGGIAVVSIVADTVVVDIVEKYSPKRSFDFD